MNNIGQINKQKSSTKSLPSSQRGMKQRYRIVIDMLLKYVWPVARTALLIILGFIIIYPLLQTITRTFMPVEQYADPSVIWVPKSLTLTNIKAAMESLDYWKLFSKSAQLSLGCAILQIISCSIIGYGFARFRFRYKKLLFAMVVLTIVIPTQLTYIPSFLQYRFFDFFGISHLIGKITGESYIKYTVNLLNSNLTFFLPSLFGVGIRSGLFIYIFRQFFRNIPKEMEEAAKIDGCNTWETFIKVMLPNAKSTVVTVLLFSVVWHWNEYNLTSTYFTTGTKPLAVAIHSVTAEQAVQALVDSGYYQQLGRNLQAAQGVAYASVILFLLPPLLLFIFAQRYFVEGIETTGIKG